MYCVDRASKATGGQARARYRRRLGLRPRSPALLARRGRLRPSPSRGRGAALAAPLRSELDMLAVAPRLRARRDAPQHAALLGADQARRNLPTPDLAGTTVGASCSGAPRETQWSPSSRCEASQGAAKLPTGWAWTGEGSCGPMFPLRRSGTMRGEQKRVTVLLSFCSRWLGVFIAVRLLSAS